MEDTRKNLSLDRLLQAASERGVEGAAAVGRQLNASDQAVNNWRLRGVPAARALEAQQLWGVSAQWISTGIEPKWLALQPSISAKEIDLENNPDFPSIRRVKFKLSAGASGFAVQYSEELGPPLTFPKEWYEKHGYKPDDLFATIVANGSMEPGLYDGDTVVVNTNQVNPKDGRVFAVNYEGELVIKRMIRDDGDWWLSSDNPDQRRYPRKRCHEGVHMVGEIIHKQSERI